MHTGNEELIASTIAETIAEILNIPKEHTRAKVNSTTCYLYFDGVPLYPNSEGTFAVTYPRCFLILEKAASGRYNLRSRRPPLQQAEVHFYQKLKGENDYKAFAHPHVFDDAHPCWSGAARASVRDFIEVIIETYLCLNVSEVSARVGRFASAAMGTTAAEGVANAGAHGKRAMTILCCSIPANGMLSNVVGERWMRNLEALCVSAQRQDIIRAFMKGARV